MAETSKKAILANSNSKKMRKMHYKDRNKSRRKRNKNYLRIKEC